LAAGLLPDPLRELTALPRLPAGLRRGARRVGSGRERRESKEREEKKGNGGGSL